MAPNPLHIDRQEQMREAVELIGNMAIREYVPEDPQEWAVMIVSAATASEAAGDAVRQDELIRAIGLLIGAVPDEEGHGLTEEQMITHARERTELTSLVRRTIGEQGGVMSIRNDDERGGGKAPPWTVMSNFGREAEDSPMVAGSAIGSGRTMLEAVQGANGERG